MQDAFFLDTEHGPRLVVHYPGDPARAPLLVLPPFAEELNKSRRQLQQLGRTLQAHGHGLLIIDLLGTGDSPGDFADARLPLWEADIRAAESWLAERYTAAPAALAIRAGILLAGVFGGARLAAWAPQPNGEQWLNGLLRLRTLASKLAGGNETSADLLRLAAETGQVEVAGYALARELIDAVKTRRLRSLPAISDLLVLEAGTPAEAPPPALASLLEGSGRRWQKLPGSSFWQSVETETHDGLIRATADWLAGTT